MNTLICSLIVAVGFAFMPAANAETPAAAHGRVFVSAAHTSTHRVLTRKGHHHRHHHHRHHSKGGKGRK